MSKIETEYLDVPMDFRIACEAFGIPVADFLQLIIRDVSFGYLFMHDSSERDLATKAFIYVDEKILKTKKKPSLEKLANDVLPLFQRLVKLSINRSYTAAMKREKARKITEKLYRISEPEIRYKSYLYLDEDTKLTLTKDFLLVCLIHQYSPIEGLNALMQCISLADLYARMHVNQVVHNPALGYYLRVQRGYGQLMDVAHINTLGFKDFILDLQEFDVRYFFIRDFEKRKAVYRARLEELFEQKINRYYDGD